MDKGSVFSFYFCLTINPFGVIATMAAYNEGGEWLDTLRKYLWGNYEYLRRFFAEQLPQYHIIPFEATYLVWIDCRARHQLRCDYLALTGRTAADGQFRYDVWSRWRRFHPNEHRLSSEIVSRWIGTNQPYIK